MAIHRTSAAGNLGGHADRHSCARQFARDTVRRGLYTVVPAGADPGACPVDPYLLASRLAGDAVLGYHTTPIRMALAIVVLVAAILILRGFALSKEPGRPATVGVGLMAGVLNGSMGIVGPPVILFYFSSPIGVVAGRASIIAYFIGTDSVGTAMFAAQGLIDASVFWRTAVFLPVLIAGVVVGNRGFVKTDPESFKKVALLVLMALSVLLLVRAAWPA